DSYFSRFHFMVEVNPPLCRLVDMESRNGTRVNGEKVTTADLKHGDRIQAGRTILCVSLETPNGPPPAPVEPKPLRKTEVAALPTAVRPRPAPAVPPAASAVREPSTKPAAATCRICGSPFDEIVSDPPGLAFLCVTCRQQAQARPQPIAGYLLVRELGKGGMGVVYLGIREADGAAVALKTFVPALTPTPDDIERFLREADILRELEHPHIVAFRDSGE